MNPLKYYPSVAAFQWGDITISPTSSGCLRSILFNAMGLRDDVPAIYGELGKVHEEQHEKSLQANETVEGYLRETPVKGKILGSNKVTYSGRMDFVVNYTSGLVEIHECKATVSKRYRLEIIRKGNVRLNHLAQLVSYMVQEENPNGRLVVGYYEDDNGTLIKTEGREFEVRIDSEGLILVDGKPSGYRVMDQLSHMQQAAKVLANAEIGPRPLDWDKKWGSPCGYCPFKKACDENERPTYEQAKASLDEHKLKPAKLIEIAKYKPKKERK